MGKWVSFLNREKKLDSLVGRRPTAPSAPKGLYIYGNVGSGMLPNFIYKPEKKNVRFCEPIIKPEKNWKFGFSFYWVSSPVYAFHNSSRMNRLMAQIY